MGGCYYTDDENTRQLIPQQPECRANKRKKGFINCVRILTFKTLLSIQPKVMRVLHNFVLIVNIFKCDRMMT